MKNKKKVLVGYSWKIWDYWFKFGDINGRRFLYFPEVVSKKDLAEGRIVKVRITIEQLPKEGGRI